MFDTHMHCEFSFDSQMTLKEASEAAAGQGIGIVVTEHWDYNYPTSPEMFRFDREKYFADNLPMRSERVLLGIEVGLQPHIAEKDDKVAKDFPFDMVIGSIHIMDGMDIYEGHHYKSMSKVESTECFLKSATASIKTHDNFDTLGHIDYICRYWPYENKEFSLNCCGEYWDEMFLALAGKEKAIEINTRRLANKESVEALLPFYKRFQQLGGKYCTIGSDAHEKEHVGRNIIIAREIAEAAGLIPVYFKNRKMIADK